MKSGCKQVSENAIATGVRHEVKFIMRSASVEYLRFEPPGVIPRAAQHSGLDSTTRTVRIRERDIGDVGFIYWAYVLLLQKVIHEATDEGEAFSTFPGIVYVLFERLIGRGNAGIQGARYCDLKNILECS